VTAVYNGENYLEATIRSILAQGYPNLEYIIVNDGSTDGTVDIIRKYEAHLAKWIDQSNQGLYAALNAGFSRTTGEILGWLNSSDMLQTHGLFVVGNVFSSFAEVEWITGRPTLIGEEGWPCVAKELRRWSRYRFLAGANQHIQQESTFWRRSLWERAGGGLSTEFRAEGDFELWVRFFRYAKLYTVDALIGGWRNHTDSLSHSSMKRYDGNCDAIIDRELAMMREGGESKLFCKVIGPVKHTRFVRGIWSRLGGRVLYKWPGSDWPPVIEYQQNHWKMRP
jgi:glycosyltransferase involved in cell wall biosynthesis